MQPLLLRKSATRRRLRRHVEAQAPRKKRDAAARDEAKIAVVIREEENEDRANVSKASPAQSKTGTRSRKRAKKET